MAQTMQYQFSRLASQINLYDLWDNLVLCSFAENYVCYLAFVIDDNKTVLNHCQTVGVHTVDDWALYYFSFCHSTSSRKQKQMYHCTNYKKQRSVLCLAKHKHWSRRTNAAQKQRYRRYLASV
jgi:hypothetical protein